MRPLLAILAFAGLTACAGTPPMTDAQRAAVADTVKTFTTAMVDHINRGDVDSAFAAYSSDADARFAENGTVSNYEAMKATHDGMKGMIESMQIRPTSTDVVVLAPDAAAVTSAYTMTIKAPGRPAYNAQGVWSGVVQRRAGEWKVVSTHESVVDAARMMAALAPPPPPPPARTPPRRR